MFNGDAAAVADENPDAAPVFIGAIGHDVVGAAIALADSKQERRTIRTMGIETGIVKFAKLNAIAADVVEDAAFDRVIMGAALKIKTGGTEVFEPAPFETNVLRVLD